MTDEQAIRVDQYLAETERIRSLAEALAPDAERLHRHLIAALDDHDTPEARGLWAAARDLAAMFHPGAAAEHFDTR